MTNSYLLRAKFNGSIKYAAHLVFHPFQHLERSFAETGGAPYTSLSQITREDFIKREDERIRKKPLGSLAQLIRDISTD